MRFYRKWPAKWTNCCSDIYLSDKFNYFSTSFFSICFESSVLSLESWVSSIEFVYATSILTAFVLFDTRSIQSRVLHEFSALLHFRVHCRLIGATAAPIHFSHLTLGSSLFYPTYGVEFIDRRFRISWQIDTSGIRLPDLFRKMDFVGSGPRFWWPHWLIQATISGVMGSASKNVIIELYVYAQTGWTRWINNWIVARLRKQIAP